MMDSEYLRLSKRISKTKEISASYVADTIIPVGSMLMWTSSALPSGWLLCDGTAVSRETYSGLFNAIGTTYGAGDNSTTFNLPNLKGKFPIGLNAQDTECDTLGETGGAKTHTLTEAELPSHDHSIAHDHASATTGTQSASHTHYHNHGSISSGSASTTTGYSAAGVTDDGTNQNSVVDYLTSSSHTHSVDIPGIDSGSQSADHTHAVDLPNFAGDSGSAGSGSAHNNMPPFFNGQLHHQL